MTPEEMQEMLDCGAQELWAVEALIASLHTKSAALAAELAKCHGLTVPVPSTRSGGNK